jgi:hypothetical protein
MWPISVARPSVAFGNVILPLPPRWGISVSGMLSLPSSITSFSKSICTGV